MGRFVWIVTVTVVIVAAIWLLFTTVFPWIESYLENPSIHVSQATRNEVFTQRSRP